MKKIFNKENSNIIKACQYLNGKHLLITFIILFIAASIDAFTAKNIYNFWNNIISSLTSPIPNMLFYLTIGFNVICYKRKYNAVFLYNRYGEFKKKIKADIESSIFISMIIYLTYVILTIAYSLIISNNNFKILNHDYYNISMLSYLIFVLLRFGFYTIIVTTITCLIANIQNDKFTISILLSSLILLTLIPYDEQICYDLIKAPVWFMRYLNGTIFGSFNLELTASIINIILYLIITYIIYNGITIKKRDIL